MLNIYNHFSKKDKPVYTHSNMLDVMSVGLITLDRDYKVIQANAQALNELKLTDEAMACRRLSDLIGIYFIKQNILPESLAKLRDGAPSVEFAENVHIRVLETNEKFYIKGQLIGHFQENRLQQVHLLFRNIEIEITQNYILNMALNHTKIFPWFFDLEHNRMIIDHRWFSHLGIPQGDCTMSSEEFAAMVHPDERDGLMDALAKQLTGTLNQDTFIYRLKRSDGTWEWFEEMSTYLGKIENTPYRIVGVCQSIQEHKNVEATLIAARDKAQESDRLKSAFLANMSHEIRTPLNAIVGFSSLIASGEVVPDGEDAREFSRLINSNCDQLLMLISDILDLSKIESNTIEFNFKQQSLNDLLKDIRQSQALNIPEGVEFILDLSDMDIHINTDPLRLRQVINNLVNNAVKFTREGSITMGYETDTNGKYVQIYVKDTGSGIPADKVEHIFERFYKADSFVKGVGLGLPICETIMEKFGGTITCVSEVGNGTCFWVKHPI